MAQGTKVTTKSILISPVVAHLDLPLSSSSTFRTPIIWSDFTVEPIWKRRSRNQFCSRLSSLILMFHSRRRRFLRLKCHSTALSQWEPIFLIDFAIDLNTKMASTRSILISWKSGYYIRELISANSRMRGICSLVIY